MEVADDVENCPNCGNDMNKSEVMEAEAANPLTCDNCGAELKEGNSFCPKCGDKVETNDENSLKCENCGSPLSENTLFCETCGTKVNTVKKVSNKVCPSCGAELEDCVTFCEECGTNVFTGEKNKQEVSASNSFAEKIDLNEIIKPSVVALITSVILSLIGLLIGFSWLSFIIAIILSMGFFAAAINNEANAVVSGLIVGLVLGLLENPLVEFMYGPFAAGFYDGFFGGHLILIVVLGIVMAYVSNIYLKETILAMTDNFKGML